MPSSAHASRAEKGAAPVITKVTLFLSLKNEAVARSLGLRRLRRPPAHGQEFQIPIDGRAVRARITRWSIASELRPGAAVPDVYAEEV